MKTQKAIDFFEYDFSNEPDLAQTFIALCVGLNIEAKFCGLETLKINDKVNLERAMKLGDRLDGHIVQGHVDQIATCTNIEEANGSWVFTFIYDSALNNITIEKGSITINGTSLTVLNSKKDSFSVAIIPYTYEHTTFNSLQKGSVVNLEFDVLGKYVTKLAGLNLLKK